MRHLAMAVLMLVLAVGSGRACSCGPGTIASSFGQSSDVFVGTVLSLQRGTTVKAQVRIERSWKGTPAGKVVTVFTAGNGAMCGVEMVAHQPVLLFAFRQTDGKLKGQLTANLCSYSTGYPQAISERSDSLGTPVTVRKDGGWWPWR
jgi:hypothetical protein